jgi:hypothetical protein
MTAESAFVSVEYGSLRPGDAFLRASNGHPIAVVVDRSEPCGDRTTIAGHIAGSDTVIVSQFKNRAVVTAVRCP